SGGKRFPLHVVFGIWRRENHRRRLREFENHTLKRRESRRIQVLDYFDHNGVVVSAQPFIAVDQRAVKKFDPLLLLRLHPIEVQSLLCDFQRSTRNVYSNDFLELFLFQHFAKQTSFATSQIQNASSS